MCGKVKTGNPCISEDLKNAKSQCHWNGTPFYSRILVLCGNIHRLVLIMLAWPGSLCSRLRIEWQVLQKPSLDFLALPIMSQAVFLRSFSRAVKSMNNVNSIASLEGLLFLFQWVLPACCCDWIFFTLCIIEVVPVKFPWLEAEQKKNKTRTTNGCASNHRNHQPDQQEVQQSCLVSVRSRFR